MQVELGKREQSGDTAALAATYHVPPTAARAGAAYAAQATGAEPLYRAPASAGGPAAAAIGGPPTDTQPQLQGASQTAAAQPYGADETLEERAPAVAAPESSCAGTETGVLSRGTEQALLR